DLRWVLHLPAHPAHAEARRRPGFAAAGKPPSAPGHAGRLHGSAVHPAHPGSHPRAHELVLSRLHGGRGRTLPSLRLPVRHARVLGAGWDPGGPGLAARLSLAVVHPRRVDHRCPLPGVCRLRAPTTSMSRPLLAAVLLGVGLVTGAHAVDAPGPEGTFALDRAASDDVKAAVDRAAGKFNFVLRPFARSRLTKANPVPQKVRISYSPSEVSVQLDAAPPVIAP